MKLGIYSDVHACYNTSILPTYIDGNKYTTRLGMVVDTFKWMYNEFESNGVELIINAGDLFDSHTLRAEEITAITEALSYSKGTEEIHIIGNHDVLDSKREFYSPSFLSNYSFIKVYNNPEVYNSEISLLPYMKADEVSDSLLHSLTNTILISHVDIKGSHLRPDFLMDSGVNPEFLAEYFNLTVNGHLHTAEKISTSKNDVWNIGNCTSVSFNDSNNYTPSICIIDTETLEIKRINNPHAILFRRLRIKSLQELLTGLQDLDKGYKYAIRVTAPYHLRDNVKDIINSHDYIVASRIISDIENSNSIKSADVNLVSNFNIKEEFIKYLKSCETLSYPLEEYLELLEVLEDVS